ncbi:MAG: L,D-transpeptidase family protein [Rhodobacteraceae bacterium]|nr:L,D-transpeptidase family protein [Paracoccaceae bacterium]
MIFYSKMLIRAVMAVGVAAIFLGAGDPASAKTVSAAVIQNSIVADQSLTAEVKSFYASRSYKPVWVGSKNNGRAKALISALSASGQHGLPTKRYKVAELKKALSVAKRGQNAGATEVFATWAFLAYAHDLSSGIVEPSRIDRNMSISNPRRADKALLAAVSKSSGRGFMNSLAPKNPEYKRLLAEKKRLEKIVGSGDFGAAIPVATLKPGSSSKNVVTMRKRLNRLGYGRLGNSPAFDDGLVKAVKLFQFEHGMRPDGVAGPGTIKMMNVSAKHRLQQVIVNLERERWLNFARGKRHIFVNQADFSFSMYDNGKESFKSDVVIGAVKHDRITPEFNDEMTHMVINPTWHVPRSIAGKEYLPMLKKNPQALARRGLRMISTSGRSVNPAEIDFSQYTAKNFPYSIKQPPSRANALGIVKFMFPNKFNIYLHDTPSKSLFKKEVRTFSHGCIRVQRPVDFAHKLLERQTSNPAGAFQAWLDTRREQFVNLEKPVPVYLSYRTAFFGKGGRVNYRRDFYGRDKKVFNALSKAGVVLQAVQG